VGALAAAWGRALPGALMRVDPWAREAVAELVSTLRGRLCPSCGKSKVTIFPPLMLESLTGGGPSGRAVLVPFWCPSCQNLAGASFSEGRSGPKLEAELLRAWTSEWPRRRK
jgi:hypothetical protein